MASMMHAMCASPARDARRSLDLLLSQMAFFGVSDTERMNTAKPVYVRPLTDSERQTLGGSLRSADAFVLGGAQVVLASAAGARRRRVAARGRCTAVGSP